MNVFLFKIQNLLIVILLNKGNSDPTGLENYIPIVVLTVAKSAKKIYLKHK